MSKFVKLSLILNIFLFVGCSDNNSIIAIAETDPVTTSGDAADDPAIIIDYRNPKESKFLELISEQEFIHMIFLEKKYHTMRWVK